jgi:hypothetical protein
LAAHEFGMKSGQIRGGDAARGEADDIYRKFRPDQLPQSDGDRV